MEIIDDEGFDLSWLVAFRNSDAFDIITILLGIILVVSFLIYKKNASDEQKGRSYKIAFFSILFTYIAWMVIGIAFK